MGANKIETVDCVKAITKYFFDKETENLLLLRPTLWKRLSKTGTGRNIVRTFHNKETGTIVSVLSDENKIRKITEEIPITSIKGYLRDMLARVEDGFWDLPYETFDDVVNWPQVSEDPDDPRSAKEPLDMENFEWLSVTDDELRIACGGDWQEPMTLTIKLINGKLTVTHTSFGFAQGMDEDTFTKIINQE